MSERSELIISPGDLEDWTDALDGLEWCLQEQRELLAAGTPELLVMFRPGPDLGPLPVELGTRAGVLLEESRRMEIEVEAELASLARARGMVDRFAADHLGAQRPAYVDRTL